MTEQNNKNTPIPDPTGRTLDQLGLAVENLKELVESKLEGIEGIVSEKFESVDRQFGLVEQQRVEQKADTKDRVDAALAAQQAAVQEQTAASEKSIAKSEAATTKSIEQLGAKFDTAFDGQRRDIDDLKGRFGITVGETHGKLIQKEQSQSWQIWFAGAAVTVIISIIIIMANILIKA